MRTLIGLLLVAAILAGCASLTPVQKTRLADYEAFAHTVTAAYGKPDVKVVVDPGQVGRAPDAMMRADGVMMLSPNLLLGSREGDLLYDLGLYTIAHELGHYVTGRYGCGVPCELDANSESVKILVVGKGWTEQRALEFAVKYLFLRAGLEAGGGLAVAPGHLPACQEIADLAARYPTYAVDSAKACKTAAGR